MRNTIKIFLIILALFIVGVLQSKIMNKNISNNKLRIAFSLNKTSLPEVDPAKVKSAFQGILVDNLYSRLVEYDNEGRLQAVVSSNFYWQNDSLYFEFEENRVVTHSGHSINANDAAVSLRRVLKLGANSHINLKYFFCEMNAEEDIYSNCLSVKVIEKKLVITPKEKKYKPFLLQALAAIDFGIIPAHAIDKNSLNITDKSETSGSYYIERADENEWVLLKNHHINNSEKSSTEIHLIDVSKKSSVDMIIDNDVDVIPTVLNLSSDMINKISSAIDASIFKTLNIKLFFLRFSKNAMSKVSTSHRYFIAKQIKNVMKEKYQLPFESVDSNQFMLEIGFGHLSDEQEKTIDRLYTNAKKDKDAPILSFYKYKALEKAFSIFDNIDGVKTVLTDKMPHMQLESDRLDAHVAITDTAYEESLSLLGYSFSQDAFNMSDAEVDSWMEAYLSKIEISDRIKLVNELHFKMLQDGKTIPLFRAPYVAIARNGFKIQQSPLFASMKFNLIYK